ncbi:YtxH domain-containing protein [Paenibacillus sp. D2_2]|uniref:YtxH domain-containing protein n=1 Tax=Paenibacillus sp. D2_2 TaxID=3073092 RepID=UPI002815D93E|nr:YtxH domain-containing protein [Paenibacillus sp. D2_2]WMT39505.1 YtxH domain-containing protein [Paenibacillus sp. D2_2]
MSKGNKGWIWGAAIGTVVGSVTALLFAPKAGRELRKDIADGARQVGEKTSEVAGKVSEQGAQIIDKVKRTTGDLIEDFQEWRGSKSDGIVEVRVSSVADNEDPLLLETAVIGVAEDTEQAAATEEIVEPTSQEADGEVALEEKEEIEEA